ncbi:4753_t:CDS:10, partial [Dentiscutata heterogama]
SLPHVFDDKPPTTPLVFISKWMDYTNKYGLGYQLTDGSVGVNFNDKTTLIMSPNGCEALPSMNEVLPKISPTYTFVDNNRTHNMEFLTKYKRTPHAVLFRLSNHLVQKIILSEEGRVITYIDEARGLNTYTISEILRGDHATEKNRLRYVKDVLKKLVDAVQKLSKPESNKVISDHSEVDNDHENETPEADQDDIDILGEYEDDAEEIELTHLRIKDLSSLDLARFQNLKKLCLRQNLITKIEGYETMTNLEDLDLYDNRISYIENLEMLKNLVSLDLSYNKIKVIENLEELTCLKNLYFVQNKITIIQNLDSLINIINLELGGNRIRVIENLDSLVNLEQLWLGKNKITELQNMENLKNLKILSIQSNRLTQIKGLEGLINLEEIYLSHNGINELEGFENNKIENIAHLENLEEFWASYNHITDFEDLSSQLSHLEKLTTVYLEGNPLQKEYQSLYRLKVKTYLPQLTQIDATKHEEIQDGKEIDKIR